MVRLNKNLKGSTLVETLAASLVLAISFGIGSMIYLNVLNAGKSNIVLSAEILAQNEIDKTMHGNLFIEESFDKGKFQIKRLIETYKGNDLVLVSIKVYLNKEELAERKGVKCFK